MNKEKLQNFEININKLKYKPLDDYLASFKSSAYNINNEKIIRENDYEYLYLTYETCCSKDVAWFCEWKKIFNIEESLRSECATYNGIILIKINKDDIYAMVFGRAYMLIKDYIVNQFGMNMASILFDGKSIDSISSKYFSLNKNKSITSYFGESTFEFEENEAVDLLKADIIDDDPNKVELNELLTFCKKKATIGMDNVKLTIQKQTIEFSDIIKCCRLLSSIEKYNPRFPFPQMTLVKSSDLNDELDAQLLQALLKEDSHINISVPFFSKDPSDQYVFLNNINEIRLKIGKKSSEVIQGIDVYTIKQFLSENRKLIQSIRKVKIIVDEVEDTLLKWIDEQIEYNNNSYAISNGKWYQFNEAYIENINKKVETIERQEKNIIYIDKNGSYSFSREELEKFYSNNRNDIQSAYGSEEQAYKEFIYNYYLTTKYEYELFDRVIFNGNIEICDLYGEDKLIHCKIGSTSKLEECIRQSLYGTRYFYQNPVDVKSKVNKKGSMLKTANKAQIIYLSDSENIENFSISRSRSLKLKQTFIDWVNMCNQINFKPQIIISKYTDKA